MLYQQGQVIEWKNEVWTIVGVGSIYGDRIYLHLASTTRGFMTKAGFYPCQCGDWLPISDISVIS